MMLTSTLFALFVGDVLKGLYAQKATDAVLQRWRGYAQGNHDVQEALKTAFVKTPTAIALGLLDESWLQRQLPFTSPKLHREFAEAMQTHYVAPFGADDPAKLGKLRQCAKVQCQALAAFFETFPFKRVTTDEVAKLLYNVRFITDADLLRQQTQLTKTALRQALTQTTRFEPLFLDFLFFPVEGRGVLYDGVVGFFEEEIKTNDRVSKLLAHFDRQQILAATTRAQQQLTGLTTQIAGLEQQLTHLTAARKFADMAAVTTQLDKFTQQEQSLQTIVTRLTQNAAVWDSLTAEMAALRNGFGLIRADVTAHFDELQGWLRTEFADVKAQVATEGARTREQIVIESNEIMRCVREELTRFLGAREAVTVQQQDFLAKAFRLWERYDKVTRLGCGGLAEVWRARKTYLHNDAVLKILLQKHRHNPETIARFWAEGKILGRLGQDGGRHFARVYDMGVSADGEFFIEMEYVPGETLQQRLDAEGRVAPPDALRLLRQLAAALSCAHAQGIVHRDIKPQNMIVHAGNVTLIDFGIAKRLEAETALSQPGGFYGTYLYAAPEQFSPKFGAISVRTDVYGLGMLGYHLLSGGPAFTGEALELMHGHCYDPLPAFPPDADVPAEVAAFIAICTQKRQDDRFQTMADVETALAEIFAQGAAEKYRKRCAAIVQTATISPEQQETLDDLREHLALSRDAADDIAQEMRELRQQQEAAENERRAAADAAERQRAEALRQQQEAAALKHAEAERRRQAAAAEARQQQEELIRKQQQAAAAEAQRRQQAEAQAKAQRASIQDKEFEFETVTLTTVSGWLGKKFKEERRRLKARQFSVDLGSGVMLDMVAVPGGTFLMGAPTTEKDSRDNERPQHTVTIQPFYFGKYPVTQAQWQAVMGNNPSRFKGERRPVEQVSWNDCQEFLEKLNATTVETHGRASLPFRLPTEAEWEYACRAGTTTPFYCGDTISTEFANYDGNYVYGNGKKGVYREQTTDVGSFPPNAFGLYDLHGNVWEWCADTWHANYTDAPTDGSVWESLGDEKGKLLRGGSWSNRAVYVRSSNRNRIGPDRQYYYLGLRVVVGAR